MSEHDNPKAILPVKFYPEQQKGYRHVRPAPLTPFHRKGRLRQAIIDDLRALPAYREELEEPLTASTLVNRQHFGPPLKFLLDGCTRHERITYRMAARRVASCKRKASEQAAHPEQRNARLVRLMLAENDLHRAELRLRETWRGAYIAHIASAKWRAFRKEILAERGRRCEECHEGKAGTVLHVHHLTYERLGNEIPEDVLLLCVPCHEQRHA